MTTTTFDRRTMLRYAAFAGGGAFATSMLASCAAPSGTEGGNGGETTGTLTLLSVLGDPPAIESMEAIAADFEGIRSGVTVTSVFDGEGAKQRLTQSIGAGEPPDIVHFGDDFIADLAAQGLLEPVTDLIEELGDIDPAGRIVIDGEDYMIPLNLGVYLHFYREDLFQQAGVEPVQTWAEHLEALPKLRSASDVYPDLVMTNGSSNFTNNLFVVNSYANEVPIWEWKGGEWELTLDSGQSLDRTVEMLEWMKARMEFSPASSTYDYTDSLQALSAGQIAQTTYAGARALATVRDNNPDLYDKVKVTRVPYGASPGTVANAAGFGIMKGGKLSRDVVKEFAMSILASDHYLDYLWTAPGHYVPASQSLRQGRWLENEDLKSRPDMTEAISSSFRTAGTVLNGLRQDAGEPNLGGIAAFTAQAYGKIIEAVLIGGVDPREAVEAAAPGIRDA